MRRRELRGTLHRLKAQAERAGVPWRTDRDKVGSAGEEEAGGPAPQEARAADRSAPRVAGSPAPDASSAGSAAGGRERGRDKAPARAAAEQSTATVAEARSRADNSQATRRLAEALRAPRPERPAPTPPCADSNAEGDKPRSEARKTGGICLRSAHGNLNVSITGLTRSVTPVPRSDGSENPGPRKALKRSGAGGSAHGGAGERRPTTPPRKGQEETSGSNPGEQVSSRHRRKREEDDDISNNANDGVPADAGRRRRRKRRRTSAGGPARSRSPCTPEQREQGASASVAGCDGNRDSASAGGRGRDLSVLTTRAASLGIVVRGGSPSDKERVRRDMDADLQRHVSGVGAGGTTAATTGCEPLGTQPGEEPDDEESDYSSFPSPRRIPARHGQEALRAEVQENSPEVEAAEPGVQPDTAETLAGTPADCTAAAGDEQQADAAGCHQEHTEVKAEQLPGLEADQQGSSAAATEFVGTEVEAADVLHEQVSGTQVEEPASSAVPYDPEALDDECKEWLDESERDGSLNKWAKWIVDQSTIADRRAMAESRMPTGRLRLALWTRAVQLEVEGSRLCPRCNGLGQQGSENDITECRACSGSGLGDYRWTTPLPSGFHPFSCECWWCENTGGPPAVTWPWRPPKAPSEPDPEETEEAGLSHESEPDPDGTDGTGPSRELEPDLEQTGEAEPSRELEPDLEQTGEAEPSREQATRGLQAVYQKHCPAKLEDIDRMLDKYPGQWRELVERVRGKYEGGQGDAEASASATAMDSGSPDPVASSAAAPDGRRAGGDPAGENDADWDSEEGRDGEQHLGWSWFSRGDREYQ